MSDDEASKKPKAGWGQNIDPKLFEEARKARDVRNQLLKDNQSISDTLKKFTDMNRSVADALRGLTKPIDGIQHAMGGIAKPAPMEHVVAPKLGGPAFTPSTIIPNPVDETNEALEELIAIISEGNAQSQELLVNLNNSMIAVSVSAKEDEKITRAQMAADARGTQRQNRWSLGLAAASLAIAAVSLAISAYFSVLTWQKQEQDMSIATLASHIQASTIADHEILNELRRENELRAQALLRNSAKPMKKTP